MKRDSLDTKIRNQPFYAKLIHECWGCHAVGLKPGVLGTRLGDYGTRHVLGQCYQVLNLSTEGLCPRCEDELPAELRRLAL